MYMYRFLLFILSFVPFLSVQAAGCESLFGKTLNEDLIITVNGGDRTVCAGSPISLELSGVKRSTLITGADGDLTCTLVNVDTLQVRSYEEGRTPVPNVIMNNSLNIVADSSGERVYTDGSYYTYFSNSPIANSASLANVFTADGGNGNFAFHIPADTVNSLVSLGTADEPLMSTQVAATYSVDFDLKMDEDRWVKLTELVGPVEFQVVSCGKPFIYEGVPGSESVASNVNGFGSQFALIVGVASDLLFSLFSE